MDKLLNLNTNNDVFDLSFINEEIKRAEKHLTIHAIQTDSYNKMLAIYEELVHLRSELISQQERLVAIFKETHYQSFIDTNGDIKFMDK